MYHTAGHARPDGRTLEGKERAKADNLAVGNGAQAAGYQLAFYICIELYEFVFILLQDGRTVSFHITAIPFKKPFRVS